MRWLRCLRLVAGHTQAPTERDFLSRVRRLTVEGKRAGEGYWSPDGKRLVFQSEREPGNPVLPNLRAGLRDRRDQADLARHGQDHLRVLPSGQRRDHVRLDAPRSQVEAVSGRRARVPRVGQGTPLRVGLRPRDGHLRLQREDRHDEAADDGEGLRRRGRLFAGWPVDRVLVDARRLQPHAVGRGAEAARRSMRRSSPRSTS